MKRIAIVTVLIILLSSPAFGSIVKLDMQLATENSASAVFYDHFDSIDVGKDLFFRFIVTNVSSTEAIWHVFIQSDLELGHGLNFSTYLAPGASFTTPSYDINTTYGYGPLKTVDTFGLKHINYANITWLNGQESPSFAYDETYYITASAAPVPVPAAVWLFGTGLIGLFGVRMKTKR